MVGRLSDFDNIFILFMKMKRRHAQVKAANTNTNYFGGTYFMYALINTNIAWNLVLKTKCLLVLVIMDMVSDVTKILFQKCIDPLCID